MEASSSQDRPDGWNGERDAFRGDLVVGAEDAGLPAEGRVLLGPAVKQLSGRDRAVVRMLLYEGRTRADVSAALDITQTEFSPILRRILGELHRATDVHSAQQPGGSPSGSGGHRPGVPV